MDKKPVTIPAIIGKKNSKAKITALTAYDFSFAKLLDATDIDIVRDLMIHDLDILQQVLGEIEAGVRSLNLGQVEVWNELGERVR